MAGTQDARLTGLDGLAKAPQPEASSRFLDAADPFLS